MPDAPVLAGQHPAAAGWCADEIHTRAANGSRFRAQGPGFERRASASGRALQPRSHPRAQPLRARCEKTCLRLTLSPLHTAAHRRGARARQHVQKRPARAEGRDHARRVRAGAEEEHHIGVPQRRHQARLARQALQQRGVRAAPATAPQAWSALACRSGSHAVQLPGARRSSDHTCRALCAMSATPRQEPASLPV